MKSFAVVGMGSIAKRHLNNLRFLYPTARIFVISSSGKNTDLPSGADAVINLDELITLKPSFVVIASPAPYHVNTAKRLLEHRIAILIEKPLASVCEHAIDFQLFSERCEVKQIAVGYCLRFLPSARVVKAFLDNSQLGTLYNVECNVGQYLPDWRADKNYKQSVSSQKELGGGTLLELSHELDYLQWMLGDLTLQHSWLRTTDELGLDVEDIADLVLASARDTYISIHLDFIQKSTQRKCEFIGANGRLVWDLIGNSVKFYHAGGLEILYSAPDYDKNKMYIDMLMTFEQIEKNGFDELATVASSTKIIKLIDDAKQLNRWRSIV